MQIHVDVVRILEYTNQVIEVTGFANSFQPLRDVLIVKAALAYDCTETGEVIILYSTKHWILKAS
jgi:hypothetical protein